MVRCGLAVVAVAVALGGCGRAPSTPPPVRLAYQHEMVTLDPHAHDDSVTGSVLSAVYEGLVSFSPGHAIRPCLAERWTSPDPTTWRLWVRPEVRFHDGRPLAVDDVVASLRRARFAPGSAMTTYLEAVADVRAVPGGEPVVEVTTRAPFPLLLTRLAMVAIVPREHDVVNPVGTGPFRWQAGSVRGPVLLRRWERYWGPRPAADEVRVRFVADQAQLEREVRGQRLDVVAVTSQDFIRTHTLAQPWRLIGIPSASITVLGVGVTHPPLDDARVRQALELAVDRRALVARAFPGGGAEPAACLAPASVVGHIPGPGPPAADAAAARGLLSSAGVAAGSRLGLVYSGVTPPVVESLVASMAEVGLRLEAREVSFDSLYRSIEEGSNELYLFGWNFGFADASDFLDAVAHSRDPERGLGLLNGGRYSNPEVDGWVEAASREAQELRRVQLLQRALARVTADRAYLPLFYHARFALVRSPFSLEPSGRAWVTPQLVTFAPS